jgi:hypothetical protein
MVMQVMMPWPVVVKICGATFRGEITNVIAPPSPRMHEHVGIVRVDGTLTYPAQQVMAIRAPILDVNGTREKHAARGLNAIPEVMILYCESFPCIPATCVQCSKTRSGHDVAAIFASMARRVTLALVVDRIVVEEKPIQNLHMAMEGSCLQEMPDMSLRWIAPIPGGHAARHRNDRVSCGIRDQRATVGDQESKERVVIVCHEQE